MLRKDTKLDELFKEARKSNSLFTDEEVNSLIHAETEKLSPKRTLTLYNLKGIKMYISLATAAAVVLIGLNLINTPTDKPLSQTKQITQSTSNTNISMDNSEPKEKTKSLQNIPKNKISDHPIQINDIDKVNVDGIGKIELTPEEAEKLNLQVKKNDKGEPYLNFYAKAENLITGIKMYIDKIPDFNFMEEKNELSKLDDSFFPKLVTDNVGNKRFYVFDSDKNPLFVSKIKNVYMNSGDDSTFNLGDIDIKKLIKLNINKLDNKDTTLKVMKLYSFCDTIKDVNKEIEELLKNNGKIIYNDEVDSKDSNVLTKDKNKYKMIIKKIDIDDKNLHRVPVKTDSNFQARIIVNNGNKKLNENVIVNSQIKMINVNQNTDNIQKVMKTEIEMSAPNSDKNLIVESNFENLIDADEVNVNDCIPVVINMGKNPKINSMNPSNEFSFILWFKPTNELIDKLPERYRTSLKKEYSALLNKKEICSESPTPGADIYFDVWRACSGSIENLKLYPNPSSGKFSTKFNLTEDRNLTFSLHDLSGRLIQYLEDMNSYKSGEIDKAFNPSNIQAGVYLIVVRSDKGEQVVQRLIIK